MKKLVLLTSLALLASCSSTTYGSMEEARNAMNEYEKKGGTLKVEITKTEVKVTWPTGVKPSPERVKAKFEKCVAETKGDEVWGLYMDDKQIAKSCKTTSSLPEWHGKPRFVEETITEDKTSPLRECYHEEETTQFVCRDSKPPKEGLDHVYKGLPKLTYNTNYRYFKY